MIFKRADKVADLIKTEISDILLRRTNDPQVREITITGVKVTDDLHQAKVFFRPDGRGPLQRRDNERPAEGYRFSEKGIGEKIATSLYS